MTSEINNECNSFVLRTGRFATNNFKCRSAIFPRWRSVNIYCNVVIQKVQRNDESAFLQK